MVFMVGDDLYSGMISPDLYWTQSMVDIVSTALILSIYHSFPMCWSSPQQGPFLFTKS